MSEVTSIEELKAAATRVVEIVGFEPDEVLKFKIRRASLTDLLEQGALPNDLLNIVFEVLKIKSSKGAMNPLDDLDPEKFTEFCKLMDNVCKAVMVEPSYEEARDLLIDAQKIQIYQYAQYGLRVLERFRERPKPNVEAGGSGEGVQPKAKQLPAGTGDA